MRCRLAADIHSKLKMYTIGQLFCENWVKLSCRPLLIPSLKVVLKMFSCTPYTMADNYNATTDLTNGTLDYLV